MKYIDAGTTAEKISNEFEIPMSELCDVFADIPASDVQPVVRCKDCKHRKEHHYEASGEPPYIKYDCNFTKYSMSPNGFCSFGARMDGGADDENS